MTNSILRFRKCFALRNCHPLGIRTTVTESQNSFWSYVDGEGASRVATVIHLDTSMVCWLQKKKSAPIILLSVSPHCAMWLYGRSLAGAVTYSLTSWIWADLAKRMWQKSCSDFQRSCMFLLILSEPCNFHVNKAKLAHWRMRDHMEQSWVIPAGAILGLSWLLRWLQRHEITAISRTTQTIHRLRKIISGCCFKPLNLGGNLVHYNS